MPMLRIGPTTARKLKRNGPAIDRPTKPPHTATAYELRAVCGKNLNARARQSPHFGKNARMGHAEGQREQHLAAVRQNGMALQDVPDAHKNRELCLDAVQNDCRALVHVPLELLSEEICLTAFRRDGNLLREIPEARRTPEICLAAVIQSASALRFVPPEILTEGLCLAAVQQNAAAIADIPFGLRTPEICLSTVSKAGMMLCHAPPQDLHGGNLFCRRYELRPGPEARAFADKEVAPRDMLRRSLALGNGSALRPRGHENYRDLSRRSPAQPRGLARCSSAGRELASGDTRRCRGAR